MRVLGENKGKRNGVNELGASTQDTESQLGKEGSAKEWSTTVFTTMKEMAWWSFGILREMGSSAEDLQFATKVMMAVVLPGGEKFIGSRGGRKAKNFFPSVCNWYRGVMKRERVVLY